MRGGDATLSDEFRALFEAEFGYVCRSLRRLGVDEADAADVAQEVFVTVHRRLPDYDRARPVRPWLFSFAVRFASNYRRLARHSSNVPLTSPAASKSPDADGEARDLVLRALRTLDFDRRTLLVMHDLEGFAAPDIAAELGVPLNTIYSRLRLARVAFREAIDELERGGGAR